MNLRKEHALLNPGRAGLKATLSLRSCVTTAELHQRASLSPVSRRSNADGNADLAGCPKDQRRSGRPLAGPSEALCHRPGYRRSRWHGHCDPAAGCGPHGQKELLLSSTDTQASQEAQVPNALTGGAAGV